MFRGFSDFLDLGRSLKRPAAHTEELAFARFKALLSYAYRYSPFYRRKMRRTGIRPDDIRTRSDLKYLPVTHRSDLENLHDLIAEPFQRRRLHRFHTSGSTGRPAWSAFDTRGLLLGKVLLKLRARLACGMKPWDKVAIIEADARRSCRRPSWLPGARRYSALAPIERTAAQIEEFRPSVLYGFPSFFRELAERCRIRPRVIFTSGELLDNATRRLLESAFGSEVYDVYGCTEVKEIAWECPAHGGYHINADWVLVEFLEQENCPERAIVATALYNYGMPLLRYRVGDAGVPVSEKCSCGITFPRMRFTCGRLVDYLTLADGTRLSPYAVTCALEKLKGLKQFQVHQLDSGQVTVKVVAERSGNAVERQVAETLRSLFGATPLVVQRVERFALDRWRKFRVVSSDRRTETSAATCNQRPGQATNWRELRRA